MSIQDVNYGKKLLLKFLSSLAASMFHSGEKED
jgi:hypothetical protein